MFNEADFQNVQRTFTKRLRDRSETALPKNVSSSQMALYQALNYYSINGIVEACFPVLTTLLSEASWQRYMEEFIANTTTRSPYFNQLPKAFLDYLKTQESVYEYPFLFELAHYEWLELYIDLLDAVIDKPVTQIDDSVLTERLVLSPCASLASYEYEVDKIGTSYLPTEKKPFDVVVYRDMTDKVKFMRINPMTKALIQLIDEKSLTAKDAIDALHFDNPSIEKTQFDMFATKALVDLLEAPVLIKA